MNRGNGTQIGRPSDRATTGTAPTVHLAPGQSARADLQFSAVDKIGGPYGNVCHVVEADGYRIYPPHSRRSVFVRSAQYACSNGKVRWGFVGYLHARPIGCASTSGGVPKGAARKTIADVDGDWRADVEWFTPTRFGITTASGATSTVEPSVHGAAEPRALSAVLHGTTKAITLIAGSRDVQVFRFAGCALRPVLDRQGHPYRFDLTGRYGNGVGCAESGTSGADQFVGLKLSRPIGGLHAGDEETIGTTPVGLTGLHAVDGRTRTTTATWPADRVAIERAATITCHALTIGHDGTTPRA